MSVTMRLLQWECTGSVTMSVTGSVTMGVYRECYNECYNECCRECYRKCYNETVTIGVLQEALQSNVQRPTHIKYQGTLKYFPGHLFSSYFFNGVLLVVFRTR